MRIPSEITERMKANFRVLYDRGVSPSEIASRWGVQVKAVINALRIPTLKDRRATAIRQVEELYQQGLSTSEIALKTGRSRNYIWNIITRYKKRQVAGEKKNG
ncbi:MAG: helix-turn-helix domain-containing protein [Thermoguttaceae bacterium]|nr:helix-turn-helix domain-containing protein [Thermoguttaceae bacterium]MBQ9454804.1 helix-turn-helix domain-containing protein [Thermoguttaceae bacterium]